MRAQAADVVPVKVSVAASRGGQALLGEQLDARSDDLEVMIAPSLRASLTVQEGNAELRALLEQVRGLIMQLGHVAGLTGVRP